MKPPELYNYDFELEFTHYQQPDGDVEKCEEHEANMVSIYKRPIEGDENGHRLAEHVCDFGISDKTLALVCLEALQA